MQNTTTKTTDIRQLTKQIILEHTPNHVHLAFSHPHRVMSSAVFNGGITHASHIVNMKVSKHSTIREVPEISLKNYCTSAGWHETTVGMMTAASMTSLRISQEHVQGVDIIVLVTSGLSNPRRVGDPATQRMISIQENEIGTINIIALTSAELTPAAMVEASMIATEAKTAAMQTLNIMSPVSNSIATGTGTDALAIVSGAGPETIRYCGKHVLFGEVLGRLVIEAVTASVTVSESNNQNG